MKTWQKLLREITHTNTFNSSLYQAFVAADILLNKLQNKSLKEFLEKYTSNMILNPDTLRKTPIAYNNTIDHIKEEIT